MEAQGPITEADFPAEHGPKTEVDEIELSNEQWAEIDAAIEEADRLIAQGVPLVSAEEYFAQQDRRARAGGLAEKERIAS